MIKNNFGDFSKRVKNHLWVLIYTDFKNYFSELCNDIFSVKNDLAEYFCENHRFDICNDYCYSDLDRPISLDEL